MLVSAQDTGLEKDSVVSVLQLVTIDRAVLSEYVGNLSPGLMTQIADGLRLVLDL